jgi:DNA-binding NtrC family response regulator
MNQNRSLKILIVDDEEIVRFTLGEFLQMIGHETDLRGDGLSGKESLQHTAYDLAFFDIRMPGLSGISLLQQALAIQPHLPIVVMSGHGDSEIRQEALMAGAFSFVFKPFRLQEISEIVENVQHIGKID